MKVPGRHSMHIYRIWLITWYRTVSLVLGWRFSVGRTDYANQCELLTTQNILKPHPKPLLCVRVNQRNFHMNDYIQNMNLWLQPKWSLLRLDRAIFQQWLYGSASSHICNMYDIDTHCDLFLSMYIWALYLRILYRSCANDTISKKNI